MTVWTDGEVAWALVNLVALALALATSHRYARKCRKAEAAIQAATAREREAYARERAAERQQRIFSSVLYALRGGAGHGQ